MIEWTPATIGATGTAISGLLIAYGTFIWKLAGKKKEEMIYSNGNGIPKDRRYIGEKEYKADQGKWQAVTDNLKDGQAQNRTEIGKVQDSVIKLSDKVSDGQGKMFDKLDKIKDCLPKKVE